MPLTSTRRGEVPTEEFPEAIDECAGLFAAGSDTGTGSEAVVFDVNRPSDSSLSVEYFDTGVSALTPGVVPTTTVRIRSITLIPH